MNTSTPASLHTPFTRVLLTRSSLCRIAFVAFLAVLGPAVLGPAVSRANDAVRLRVLSFNIHHAAGVDGKLDLQRIARVIRSVKPDIVALQEVDQGVRRSQSVDQPEELAKLTQMHFAFGKNIPLQGGHYGNAVLTKFPILRHKNHPLPNVANGEQRGVMVVEIDCEPSPVVLFATHLDHRKANEERIASAVAINRLASAHSGKPMLLAGDLNAVIGSETLNRFDLQWTRANAQSLPTVPVANPQRQIDFVLFGPSDRWAVVDVKVLDESVASDHRPFLVTLDLLPKTVQ